MDAELVEHILRSAAAAAREFGQDGERVSVEVLEAAADLIAESRADG